VRLRQTVADRVPTLKGFPASAGHSGGGQSPDHVAPAHAAALGSIEPVQMFRDQLRELLPPSTRKMEVLHHCRQPGFQLFVVGHPQLSRR
jgi:hypothetical protein